MEWFYVDKGERKGPVTPDELQALAARGEIHADTLVWHAGMEDWVPAGKAAPELAASAVQDAKPYAAAVEVTGGAACPAGAAGRGSLCDTVAPARYATGAVTILSGLVMTVARFVGWRALIMPLIKVATLGFLATALLGGALRTGYGRLLFVGLFFCAVGDFVGPSNFVMGSLAFLVAHLWFIAAFCFAGVELRRCLLPLAVFAVVAVAVGFWLFPHLKTSDYPLVVGYMLVISTMVVLAWGLRKRPGRTLVVVGAVIFFVSDLFVANWAFGDKGSYNAFFCYPMYYIACTLIALSAYAFPPRCACGRH